MKVGKSNAIALLLAVGKKNAPRMTDEKLAENLEDLEALVNDDTELPDDLADLAEEILEADDDIEIVADAKGKGKKEEKTPAKAKGKAKAKPAEDDEEDEEEEDDEEDEEEEEEAPKKKTAKGKKAAPPVKGKDKGKKKPAKDEDEDEEDEEEEEEAPKKKAAKDKAAKGKKDKGKDKAAKGKKDKPKKSKPKSPPGVSYKETACFYAGVVIKDFGLEAGVTQEMVDAVGELAGRQNDHQDWFNLRNAWQSIRAYTGELDAEAEAYNEARGGSDD